MVILYYLVVILIIILGNDLIKKVSYVEEQFGKDIHIKKGITRDGRHSELEELLRWEIRKRKKQSLILLVLLPIILPINMPAADLRITMIDVGQGDSIFISGPSEGTYLIDGGSTDISSVGKYRIESFLLSQGVSKIDYVFISHGDADHYNGIAEMMQRQTLGVKIKNLVLAEESFLDDKLRELAMIAQENDVKVLLMAAGNVVCEKDLKFVCIAPNSDYEGEIGNASSMVLDISYRNFDMLFTGDIEGEGEKDFITNEYNLKDKYEILKVSHHGSKNSTPLEFLELINPDLCLISAGVNSRYGHPHAELTERLRKYTDKIWVTSEVGAISIEYFDFNNKLKLKSFL